MTKSLKRTLGGIAIAIVLGVTYVFNFGLFPKFFDIEWDEEVKLHDGRVIWVHVKRTFERRGLRLSRWDGIHRDTEIGFESNSSPGKIHLQLERYNIDMVDTDRGRWYFLLRGMGHIKTQLVEQAIPIYILDSSGNKFPAKRWQEVPYFPRSNLMPVTPDSEGIKQFHGKKLSIEEKMHHWRAYPRAAGDNGERKNVGGMQPPTEQPILN